MISDKKNTSKKINFITIKGIGKVNIKNQISIQFIKKFLTSQLLK